MVGEIFAGLSALNAALNSAKALKDINDAAIRNTAVIELQEKILTAREAQSQLLDRIRELEEKVAGFEKWDAEKDKYELKSLGGIALAMMLKPSARNSQPPHWVCTHCYGNGKAVIMQHHGFAPPQVGQHWKCPECKMLILPREMHPRWLDESEGT